MSFAVTDESATFLLAEERDRALMQINHLVRGIGDDSLFILLFKWPDGLSKFEYAEADSDFLQITGKQDGLTVELMKEKKLFTLGHKGGDPQRLQLTRQDGSTLEVSRNEVLSPDEAVGLFTEYYNTDSVDTSRWNLRPIALDSEGADSVEPSQAQASFGASQTSVPAASVQAEIAGQTKGAADEDRGERGSSA